MKKILLAMVMVLMPFQFVWAAEPAPSDASLNELMTITHAQSMVTAATQQVDAVMRASMEQVLKGKSLTAEQKGILDDMRAQLVALIGTELRWEKLKPQMLQTYRTVFTQKEVDGMLAFYKTEAGQAVIEKMPAVMQASMQTVQGTMTSLMPKMAEIQKTALARLKETEKPKQ